MSNFKCNKRITYVSVALLALSLSAYQPNARANNSAKTALSSTKTLVTQNEVTCKGRVYDKQNQPVISASVLIKGTLNGVITDLNGNFVFEHLKPGTTLEISCIGYETKFITWNGGNLNVVLSDDTKTLEEVVVTGYGGTQLRSKVTNSIAKVKKETLTNGIFSNPAQALSGAVAGLKVSQTSGNPGAAPSIVLRGGTNFNGTGSPLILIDGQVRGSLSDINPDDIESMEVLKDAGATAIYGARANDGVILITTKKGQAGHSSINFSAKLGFNYFHNHYDFLGAEDYLHYMRLAYKNADVSNLTLPNGKKAAGWANINSLKGATPFGTGNAYFAADGVTPLDGNETSSAIWSPMIYSDKYKFLLDEGWKTMKDPVYGDEIIFKEHLMEDFNIKSPAISQNYYLNASGGNDKGHYYAGLGYNKSEGNGYGNEYQRSTFILNADYKIKPWLTSYSSVNFADAKWRGLPPTQGNESNYFSRVFSVPSTFRGYNPWGEELLGANSSDGNQKFNFDNFVIDNNSDKITFNQSLLFDLYDGLTLKLGGIWFFNEGKNEYFEKDYMQRPGRWNRAHYSTASQSRTLDKTYNAILNYKKVLFEDHSIDAMFGFEYYDSYTKGFSASGSGAPTDDFMDLELTSEEEGKRKIDSWHNRQRIMSFFGRLNYDYQSKYLLSFVMRKDGYSRLAKDNRWGIFPGVSTGWVFSNEDFMDRFSHILSFGKLRASFGLNGNVNPSYVGYYTVQGSYSGVTYDGEKGFSLRNIPNPFLKWEKSRTFEIGTDLSFLENKINANITYYNRLTSDKYANITVPGNSGTTSVTSNNGKLKNTGLEFELNFKVLNKNDWKWNIGWVGAYNYNEIVQLPDNDLKNNRQGGLQVWNKNKKQEWELKWVGGYQEGQRPGDLYVYRAEGIYRSQDEIPAGLIDVSTGNNGSNNRALYSDAEGFNRLDDAQKKSALPIKPGDVKWKDVNGDGIIDQFDKEKVGNLIPKYTGGFNTQLSYKGITLSAKFDYALGFKIIDYRTPWIMSCAQGTYNTINDTKNSWSPDNPNAKYPTYVWADQLGKRNYCRDSDMFVYNGNYLSIREINLSYRLPKAWVSKVALSDVVFSVTGQNLGYLTEAPHVFSPESSSNNSGYPLPRTLIFGVNVSF